MRKFHITIKNKKFEIEQDDDGKFILPEYIKEQEKFGSQLKPSYEPIIVARKPVENSIVDNVIKYGVGGINIDECRVGNEEIKTQGGNKFPNLYGNYNEVIESFHNGRFPANTILTYDDNNFEEVCGNMPNTKGNNPKELGDKGFCFDTDKRSNKQMSRGYDDSGSASRYFKNCKYTEDDFYDIPQRYFYSAKASKQDRDEGLDEFEDVNGGSYQFRQDGSLDGKIPIKKNIHPTVKPCELLRYLVRLVTPKGGIILDCFNGSGSTGKAVMYENKENNKDYKYIGIEMTEEYLPISKARIEYYCDKDITENIIAEKISKEKPKPKQTEKQNKKSSNQICMFE